MARKPRRREMVPGKEIVANALRMIRRGEAIQDVLTRMWAFTVREATLAERRRVRRAARSDGGGTTP